MVGKMVFQCSPCKMLAVVGRTPGLRMHQGLLCRAGLGICPLVPQFPQKQSGMRYLNARWRNAGCCRAVPLQEFLILLQQEKLKHFLKATPTPPCRILFVCFGPESGQGLPGDTKAVAEPRGGSLHPCRLARGWHPCLFTFSSPDYCALPCCRRQPVGCQPCLGWQEPEINLWLKQPNTSPTSAQGGRARCIPLERLVSIFCSPAWATVSV